MIKLKTTAYIYLSGVIQTVLSKKSAHFCPIGTEYYVEDTNETIQEFIECPGPDDPPHFTLCCPGKCCELEVVDSLLGLDISYTIALSLTVILACLVAGVGIVICCFSSRCPMYDTCAGGYKRRDKGNIPFGDLDCRDTDPLTSGRDAKYYTAPDIKVTKADHV